MSLCGKAAAPFYYIITMLQLTVISPWLIKHRKNGMYLRTDKIGPGAWRQKRSAPIIPYLSGDFTGKFPLCIHGEIRSEPYRPPEAENSYI